MSISFSKLNIQKKDLLAVKNIIKSGWLTHGKYTSLFENEFKKFTNSKYAITVSSCTAALHLSCLAAGFQKNDEVIVPAQTHTATAHAVEYSGAKAIFTDVENYSGNISLDLIKKKVTKKTRGLILVHMAGIPCDLEKIYKYCKKKNILIIEDCAHALGTNFKKKHVGNYGIAGCFSFYPTKQITTGEGGMLITNSRKIYEKIKMLKGFGIDKDINNRKKPGEYNVKLLGYNYRMTDFQAALGYFQLKRYKKNLLKRKNNAKLYIKYLKNSSNIKFEKFSENNSYFIFQIFCEKRDKMLEIFKKKKIGVSIHYNKVIPLMTYYRKKYNLNEKNFKNAIHYSKTNISLPVYPKLSSKEIKIICKNLINFADEK